MSSKVMTACFLLLLIIGHVSSGSIVLARNVNCQNKQAPKAKIDASNMLYECCIIEQQIDSNNGIHLLMGIKDRQSLNLILTIDLTIDKEKIVGFALVGAKKEAVIGVSFDPETGLYIRSASVRAESFDHPDDYKDKERQKNIADFMAIVQKAYDDSVKTQVSIDVLSGKAWFADLKAFTPVLDVLFAETPGLREYRTNKKTLPTFNVKK